MKRHVRTLKTKNWSVALLSLLACITLAAGCGGAAKDAGVAGSATRARSQVLSHGAVSITVPDNWYGRVLFLDSQGTNAILQVANFKLPPNQGFEPPEELPPGQEDPIKAMAGGDDLIMINTAQTTGPDRSLPVRITPSSFLPPDSPEIPRSHAIAREAGCFSGHCLRITVDFATAPPPNQVVSRVNDVLSSLAVR